MEPVDYRAAFDAAKPESEPFVPQTEPVDVVLDQDEPPVEVSAAEEVAKDHGVKEPKDSPDTHVEVNTGGSSLNVRKQPKADADVRTVVPNKARLKVINEDNPEWLFVETGDGTRGYVKKPFVTDPS